MVYNREKLFEVNSISQTWSTSAIVASGSSLVVEVLTPQPVATELIP